MPCFFITSDSFSPEGCITIIGEDAHHISRSLRMAAGEHITVADQNGILYDCALESFLPDCVIARICGAWQAESEPPYRIHLYQGLPKGDKLEMIIQKSVECGVYDITPFESEYCVVRMRHDDGEAEARKLQRRQKIATEAAKQCGRGILPQVFPPVTFVEMLKRAAGADLCIFCYEGQRTVSIAKVLADARETLFFKKNGGETAVKTVDISVIIGSEGGFSPKEAELACNAGAIPTGLGKRILRTETAPVFALSVLSYAFELSGL